MQQHLLFNIGVLFIFAVTIKLADRAHCYRP